MVRIICLLLGVLYAATGFWMLLAPASFYPFAQIGAYNHHFIADIGTFIIPIGFGLLFAARDPIRYRSLVDVALLASALHLGNHLTDGFVQPLYWQTDIALTLVLALNAYASWATRHGSLRQRPA